MKKVLPLILLICFILWIAPLGFFIKPSQQKLACDGQRAFCMCHVMMTKSSDHAMETGIALKEGSSTNKENSSGGGNDFISSRPTVALTFPSTLFLINQHPCYISPFLASLEHVPKI
jgi:hypothetical protein